VLRGDNQGSVRFPSPILDMVEIDRLDWNFWSENLKGSKGEGEGANPSRSALVERGRERSR